MALELFGEDFKNELFQDLVKLNIEALKEAKRQVSRQINAEREGDEQGQSRL